MLVLFFIYALTEFFPFPRHPTSRTIESRLCTFRIVANTRLMTCPFSVIPIVPPLTFSAALAWLSVDCLYPAQCIVLPPFVRLLFFTHRICSRQPFWIYFFAYVCVYVVVYVYVRC